MKTISFAEAVDLYINRLKETGKDSRNSTLKYLNLKRIFPDIIINYENNDTLLREFTLYRQKLLSSGYANATINRNTALVQSIMNLLKKLEFIRDNPITSFRFPKLKVYPRDRILTASEEKTLLDCVKRDCSYIYPLVQFCLIVPSRWIAELLYATVDQYQRENNVIYIPAARSKARIPIYKPVPAELQDYFDNLNSAQKYLFFTEKVPKLAVWADFKTCCKKIGLEKSFTLHNLRHCAISKLVNNGNNTWDICSVTGWTTPNQLTTYYHMDRLTAAKRLNFSSQT